MESLQTKLFEAATQGSIKSLQELLKGDPLILDRAALDRFNETPLHIAAMLGHVDFVKEVIRVKPELVGEVNSEKSSPLHLASAKGHVEVVRALLCIDGRACLSRDRNNLTPLHLAAAKGRVEVVKVLLEAQPDAAYRGQSILHLCVERCQLQTLEVLVRALGEAAFVNSVDVHGNTVLHLAVADKQVETVRFLVSVPAVEVNAQNNERMTALDVLIGSRRDVRDSEIENSLKHGGAQTNNTRAGKDGHEKNNSWKGSLKQHEDWLEKTKSALMVVASLTATMAFQIGVNPPGGVWQDDRATDSQGNPVEAGSSVFAHKYSKGYERFYIINTVAFIASLTIILLLMSGLPFMRRRFFVWVLMLTTWIAISAIALCYLVVVAALTPGDKLDSVVYVIGFAVVVWLILMALLLLAHTVRVIVKLVKKLRKIFWGRCTSLV